jgi:Family of unknown function (DUF695)
MKRIAVVLGLALIASSLIAATPAPVPDKGPNNGWIVTTSKQHDHLLLLKVRAEVPADVQPAKYPNAVEMHWKYVPDSKGMPAEKVITQIAKFEATLDPLQGDRVGYLMMIVTGSGERTWLWYAADPKAFATELNQLIPGHPFPITLNAAAKEPDWKTYRALREKIH